MTICRCITYTAANRHFTGELFSLWQARKRQADKIQYSENIFGVIDWS